MIRRVRALRVRWSGVRGTLSMTAGYPAAGHAIDAINRAG